MITLYSAGEECNRCKVIKFKLNELFLEDRDYKIIEDLDLAINDSQGKVSEFPFAIHDGEILDFNGIIAWINKNKK